MIRLLRDLRYKWRHKREATSRLRLTRLTDDPFLNLMGYAAWCDGRLKPCGRCGGRCCDCHHTEVPR